jgi:hypothetical protein
MDTSLSGSGFNKLTRKHQKSNNLNGVKQMALEDGWQLTCPCAL